MEKSAGKAHENKHDYITQMSDNDLRETATMIVTEMRRRLVAIAADVSDALAGRPANGRPLQKFCKRGHDQETNRIIEADGKSRGCRLCHRDTTQARFRGENFCECTHQRGKHEKDTAECYHQDKSTRALDCACTKFVAKRVTTVSVPGASPVHADVVPGQYVVPTSSSKNR